MKLIGILSALFAAVAVALAQNSGTFTPVPPPSQPRSQIGAPPGVAAPAAARPPSRIPRWPARCRWRTAFKWRWAHNLDVQIQRINPQISLYNLNAAYSAMTCRSTLPARIASVTAAGRFKTASVYPGTINNANSFNSGLGRNAALGVAIRF